MRGYNLLAEESIDFKWEHRRILLIIVDADFVNSALFIFTIQDTRYKIQEILFNVGFE